MSIQEPQFAAATESENEPPTVTLTSEELFQGGREIWIEHRTEMYRLRITSRGKLILTK